MNRIVVTELFHKGKPYLAYLVLDENRELVELQVFAPEEETVLGDIYVGYVEKVAKNIGAAFVRTGEGRKCFLPLEDIKSPIFTRKQSKKRQICEGDELLVQVVKDAVKTKDAVVSTKLTLHGSYCFLTTDNTNIGVSHKLSPERAEALSALAVEACEGHEAEGYGLVFRTNAGEQDDEALHADIASVVADYGRIRTEGLHHSAGTLLYRSLPGYIARLKGQELANVDKIYTDLPRCHEEIAAALPGLKESGKLVLYDDSAVSLAALYNLGGTMDRLLGPKVWLPSGANLIIEPLETLTVIDVNSAKNTSKKPAALFSVNLEAAREIARQLRLRNISGMILVDFINMEREEQRQELILLLKEELGKDTVPARFIDITGLGLVELTRKKVYKSLREVLNK